MYSIQNLCTLHNRYTVCWNFLEHFGMLSISSHFDYTWSDSTIREHRQTTATTLNSCVPFTDWLYWWLVIRFVIFHCAQVLVNSIKAFETFISASPPFWQYNFSIEKLLNQKEFCIKFWTILFLLPSQNQQSKFIGSKTIHFLWDSLQRYIDFLL